jgi:hypothetical protein
MQIPTVRWPILMLAALAISPAGFAQTAPKQAAKGQAAGSFDPHDLSGVWQKTRGILLTMSNQPPPFTPEGQAKFNAAKPLYGPRTVPGAKSNDPSMGTCDPVGIPRQLFLEVSIYNMEFVPAKDRTIQFFEWAHDYRNIWTDGRALPKDPDPRWQGYSTGKWEGDTFAVTSVGFDDRTWLDHFGNPISDALRLEERYRRVDPNNLEMVITVNDPKIYTKPWVSDKKTLRLVPKGELSEIYCVPSEEQAFNKGIRDPAAGKTGK